MSMGHLAAHLLLAGLIQADQDLVVRILALIDFQHVLHGADKLGAALRRDAAKA